MSTFQMTFVRFNHLNTAICFIYLLFVFNSILQGPPMGLDPWAKVSAEREKSLAKHLEGMFHANSSQVISVP